MGLDSSNSLAYYCKGLIYHALEDNTNAKIELENLENCNLNDNDNLAKVMLSHLECLLCVNNYKDISFVYFLQKNSDLQLYLFNCFKINYNDFTEFGIINKFNKLMFKGK